MKDKIALFLGMLFVAGCVCLPAMYLLSTWWNSLANTGP